MKNSDLPAQLVEDFKHSMVLREDADYSRNFSKEGATAAIKCAEQFKNVVTKILKK